MFSFAPAARLGGDRHRKIEIRNYTDVLAERSPGADPNQPPFVPSGVVHHW